MAPKQFDESACLHSTVNNQVSCPFRCPLYLSCAWLSRYLLKGREEGVESRFCVINGDEETKWKENDMKWVVNKISSWPGLCNVRGLLSMRLPQTHLCYSTLGKISSLELCPAAHSPGPTWLQNFCGGQFHVQCQGPARRIYMKSIHFSASEGELTLKCRVIGALGQSSTK